MLHPLSSAGAVSALSRIRCAALPHVLGGVFFRNSRLFEAGVGLVDSCYSR